MDGIEPPSSEDAGSTAQPRSIRVYTPSMWGAGLEPAMHVSAPAFETGTSTDSATPTGDIDERRCQRTKVTSRKRENQNDETPSAGSRRRGSRGEHCVRPRASPPTPQKAATTRWSDTSTKRGRARSDGRSCSLPTSTTDGRQGRSQSQRFVTTSAATKAEDDPRVDVPQISGLPPTCFVYQPM